MQTQFVLMTNPQAVYQENGETIVLVLGFLISTPRYYEPESVILTAIGETADTIANYGRVGTLLTVSIGRIPDSNAHAIQTHSKEFRWDYLLRPSTPVFFLEEAIIAIPEADSDEAQDPPELLSEMILFSPD